MYRRLVFLLILLVMVSLACAQLPGLAPDSIATQSAELIESTVIPQSFPTPELHLPTDTAPVPTHSIPTPTPPVIQEHEPTMSGEGESQEDVLYMLQSGSPIAIENIFHPDIGCNWMGIGGQVIGETGQPVGMLVVAVGGELQGTKIEALTLTGSASHWGPGGFEIKLSERPILSSDSIWVQLLDLEGLPLSEKIYIDTFENCEQAAVLVNFIHVSAVIVEQIYLPVIHQDQ